MLKLLMRRKLTVVVMVSSATILAMLYLNVYSLVGGMGISSSSNINNVGYSSQCNTSVIKEEMAELNRDLPIIYFITPTFSRAEQIAEMTRLGKNCNLSNICLFLCIIIYNYGCYFRSDTAACAKFGLDCG